jgi:MoxR-like ATPase
MSLYASVLFYSRLAGCLTVCLCSGCSANAGTPETKGITDASTARTVREGLALPGERWRFGLMGAPKAQDIRALSNDRQSVTIARPYGGGTFERSVWALSRTDLIRTAKLAFPETAGNLWISQDNPTILAAIVSGTLPESINGGTVPASTGPDNHKALCDAQDQIARLEDELRDALARPTVTMPKAPVSTDHRHPKFDLVYLLASLGKNVYLVGPAGTGKSTLAAHVADALGRPFYAMSCHAQMTGASLSGYMDAQGRYVATDFRHAYVGDLGSDAGVYCLDEIDNGNPNILASTNSAIANGHASFADGGRPRHPDFVMIATANTFGTGATAQYVGRNPLDAATKDRFVMVEIDYDTAFERERASAVGQSDWCDRIQAYRSKVAEYGLKLILSTRCIIDGADMLAAGIDLETVLATRVFAGVPEDQVRKVREADVSFRKVARKSAEPAETVTAADDDYTLITARFHGRCQKCAGTVNKGEAVFYRKGDKSTFERSHVVHVGCK